MEIKKLQKMKKPQIINNLFFFIFSIFLTIYLVCPNNLWFSETDWLYGSGDLTNAQLSWQYFQHDYWRFPLGKNPNYGLEISNSIVFTDNIPLFAILFKIFSPFFQKNFQYFSLWIFLSFFLQLSLSYLLINKITKDNLISFVGSYFFLFSPFFLFRLTHHFSLGAHWLILYAFYISYFVENKKNFHWYFLIFLSLSIHLYFTLMILIINACFALENACYNKKFKVEILSLFYKFIFALTIMYIIGYFESSPINAVSSGYGIFKIDLLSFFDPQLVGQKTWSMFLKDLPGTHLEGFTYLGLGNIMLLFLSFIIYLKNKVKKKITPKNFEILRLGNIFIFLFFVWSITTNISILGNEIISLDLPKYVFGVLSIFSSTGRFAWPVIYVLIFFSIFFIYKNTSKLFSVSIFGLFLIVQIFDISTGFNNHSFKEKKLSQIQAKDPIWKVIEKDFEIIRTTYLFHNYGSMFSKLSKIIAETKGIKTDIILNAAMDRQKAAKVRYDLNNKLNQNGLENNTAYLVDNLGHLKQLKFLLLKKDYGFFYRDDFWIILPGKKSLMNENDIIKLNKVNIDEIEINKKYDLKFRDKFLGFGWSHDFKKRGVWSEGENSFLLFKTSKETKKILELELFFSPYGKNKNSNYFVEIFVNNKLNNKINLNEKKNAKVLFKDTTEKGEFLVHFKFNGLISPYQVFESPDARKLGILINSIILKEKS